MENNYNQQYGDKETEWGHNGNIMKPWEFTICECDIAMENGPWIDGLPKNAGMSIAMIKYRRVYTDHTRTP